MALEHAYGAQSRPVSEKRHVPSPSQKLPWALPPLHEPALHGALILANARQRPAPSQLPPQWEAGVSKNPSHSNESPARHLRCGERRTVE